MSGALLACRDGLLRPQWYQGGAQAGVASGEVGQLLRPGDFQALAAGPRMSVGVPNTNAMCRRGRS